MGTYYRAVIVVGLPREDLKDKFEDLDAFADENNLEIISPVYDGSSEDCAIVGFTLQESDDYQASILHFPINMGDTFRKFKEITGIEPKLWLSPQCT